MKPIYALALAILTLPVLQVISQSRRRARWRKMAEKVNLRR